MKWSWLQNPAVALIELLASVIAVSQSVAWLCRYIYRLTHVEGEPYRRARIAAALAALVVVVAFSAVTWPVLMAAASKIGDGGVMGALYPITFDGLALTVALGLFIEACEQRRFPLWWCAALFGVLGYAAMLSFFQTGGHGWMAIVSAALLGVAVVMITPFAFIRGTRRTTAPQAKMR